MARNNKPESKLNSKGISYEDVVKFVKNYQNKTEQEIANNIFAKSIIGFKPEDKILKAITDYNDKIEKNTKRLMYSHKL